MKKITLDEIYNFRVDIKNAKLSNNKRGLNVVFDPCYIEENLTDLWKYIDNEVRAINPKLVSDTYTEYTNFRELSDESIKRIRESVWWLNDGWLLDSYVKLWKQINELVDNYLKNPNSKNNIAYQTECCYSGVIASNDILQVQCRSTDMYFGVRSDIIVFALLAKELNCNKLIMIFHQPHYYLNTTKVNRRKDEDK